MALPLDLFNLKGDLKSYLTQSTIGLLRVFKNSVDADESDK
jgi:hypothetical protein